jgi:acetoin utilization deacetylase AcuC-like enzyme
VSTLSAIPVFYTPKMVAESLSFSPSSMKPRYVVDAWKTGDVPIEIVDVPPILIDDIYLAHEVPYVDGVLAGQIENGFENFSLDIAYTLLYTNGSMRDAAKRAIENSVMAVSPTSGFHHAFHYAASGFCTFNGLMIAAQWLLKNSYAKRIGIVDCDFHYGNGTDQIINKLDCHRQVKHFTAGRDFYRAEHAPAFFEKLYDVFRYMQDCDVILYQAGADPHIDDPLGGFLTTEQLYQRDLLVFTECANRGLPVAWNFAGGYQQHADESTNWEALIEIHSNTLKAAWQVVQ